MNPVSIKCFIDNAVIRNIKCLSYGQEEIVSAFPVIYDSEIVAL